MRLICGIFHLDGADADEGLLRRMAAQMDVPRLRPALTVWHAGPVGLAVLDFARAAGSVSAESGGVIAADVRLDAPDAVRRELGGTPPAGEDALLSAVLDRFGPGGLDRVLGDFAFARWDGRAERLICGRDVFGIRPLSYTHQPGRLFAFASLPQALHGSGLVPKRIDEAAVARRTAQLMRFDDSLIAGIRRLPPAHILAVSREGLTLTRYWQLDRDRIGTVDCPPEEAARELRRLVDEAVRCRLPPTGEIGAHLSGGLDSSALSVLAARHLRGTGRSLHAYSFLDRQRNDITLEDETEFVRAVLAQEGDIDWTPIRPPVSMEAGTAPLDADKMTPLGADEPENAVCARAEGQGVGLILSGWGGDEGATFNGRGALAELFLRGRWRRLADEIAARKRERGWSVPRLFYDEIVCYLVPGPLLAGVRRAAGKKPPLTALFPRALSAEARRILEASGDRPLAMAPDGRENRWRLMTSPHIAERAEVWAATGARHGLAFAFPLLDRRVVEYSLSLASALFLRDGFRRRPFRDAMAGVLPERVRLRHLKYRPFPSHMIDLAESRDAFLARIDAYERDDRICRLVDLAHLRRQVEAFPSPDEVRANLRRNENPEAAVSMVAADQALKVAAYLAQHGDEAAPSARRA